MSIRHGWRVFLAAALLTVAFGPPTAVRAATLTFYEGTVSYSRILNCFSVIGGYPYDENGAGVWVGVQAAPESAEPKANQSFDIAINVFGLGNSCSGQRFIPAFSLPAGLSRDTSRSVTCWTSFDGKPLTQAVGANDCPGSGNLVNSTFQAGATMYLSSDTQNARAWPLPSGVWWQFRIPVKASSPLTNGAVRAYVKMFDGNDSPVLAAQQGAYVYGNTQQPSVWYDQPSTVVTRLLPDEIFHLGSSYETPNGLYSVGYVLTTGLAGRYYFDIGTSPGSYTMQRTSIDAETTGTSFQVAFDWDDGAGGLPLLTAGTTYYWRLVFDPGTIGGSDQVFGAEQSFTMPNRTTCNGLDVTVNLAFGQLPTDGNDVILGTPGDDTIAALAGSDTVCAGGGNDTVLGGLGNDWVDGEGGIDTISYANAPAAVTVRLDTTAAQNTVGEGLDTLRSVENVVGGPDGDTLTGNGSANVLGGGGGSDRLVGAGGADTALGGDGDDTFDAGGGNDVFDGGVGNDTFLGGADTDTATYASAAAGVTVNLGVTSAQDTRGAGRDTLSGVENLTGGPQADTLTGSRVRNTLSGANGRDTLRGGRGNDALAGGAGRDTCDGGAGTDTRSGCEVVSGFP